MTYFKCEGKVMGGVTISKNKDLLDYDRSILQDRRTLHLVTSIYG